MDIAQRLRSEGFKVTPQRIAIFNALSSHMDHPTAEMVYQSLRAEHPTMSLATVYKTMEIFKRIGLVKVLDVGDDCSRYDWNTHSHPHIRCTVCNRVDDLQGFDMAAISNQASQASDYKITGQQVSFEGICPDCARKGTH